MKTLGNKKIQITVQVSQQAVDKLNALKALNPSKSRNQIIEDCINMYYGFTSAEISQDFLCQTVGQKVEGVVGQFDNHLGRILFKQSLEMNVLTKIMANSMHISKDEYERLRKTALDETRSSKGIINIYEA